MEQLLDFGFEGNLQTSSIFLGAIGKREQETVTSSGTDLGFGLRFAAEPSKPPDCGLKALRTGIANKRQQIQLRWQSVLTAGTQQCKLGYADCMTLHVKTGGHILQKELVWIVNCSLVGWGGLTSVTVLPTQYTH